MRLREFARAGVVALALSGGGASAQSQSEVLFSHKHWQVTAVAFDDGALACKAEVSSDDNSFAVWVQQDSTLRLQFYSTDWEFDGGTANLRVQIDRREDWTLTNAELYKNSVLFDLPAGDAAGRFLVEIAQGTKLHLRTEENEGVKWYSLAGSRSSMEALMSCAEALDGSGPSNPFQ